MTAMIYVISHPDCFKHQMGPTHPESPYRIKAIQEALLDCDFSDKLKWHTAPQASDNQLIRVHAPKHLEFLRTISEQGTLVAIDADTKMNPYTLSAAYHAAGALVEAVDLVMGSETQKVFCLVRPPGHHAMINQAMGFCFFNNVMIGAMHAIEQYHCQQIAIVDFDVHHGNGTEQMIDHNPKIALWSSFQHPFYPGAILDNKPAHIKLVPLSAGCDSLEFQDSVSQTLEPWFDQVKPQLVFISAGFDGHRDDRLANLNLEANDYYYITKIINRFAKKYAQGRVISTLEGGYHLKALKESVTKHLEALLD